MKILIVNPPTLNRKRYIREGRCEQRLDSFQYVMLPVSLTYVAALLHENKFEVKIVDCIAENISVDELKKIVLSYLPQLIIYNISTVTYFSDLRIVESLKEISNAHISAMGVHVSVLHEQCLRESMLDSVIRGEPEITALCLAKALRDEEDLSTILGLSYKKDERVVINAPRDHISNLDKLPFPARYLVNNEKYVLPVINRPYTLLVPSRGCPYSCIFCTASCYYGKRPRFRSIANVIDEIKEIVEKYGIEYITMWSDTFTLDRNYVISLCEAIKNLKRKFFWMCNSRVDRVDPEMLKKMAESGCIGISYGVESADEGILKNVKKNIDVSHIKNAFRWTKDAGIETLAHFILGLPGETKETIKKTIKLAKEIEPDYVQFYCAIPFPGTEYYSLAIKNNWLTTSNWEKFELNQAIVSSENLSSKQLAKERVNAYLSFYFRPKYIYKMIKKINKFRDLFLYIKQVISFIKNWVK